MKKDNINIFWSDVSTKEKAEKVVKDTAFIPILVAVISAIASVYSHFYSPALGFTIWSLLDAFLFTLIAIGMRKISRIVTTLGLAFYIWGQVLLVATQEQGFTLIAIFFTIYWFNGVRGAFNYHRLKKQSEIIQTEAT